MTHRILDANGVPVIVPNTEAQGVSVASDFSLQTGRGSVYLEVPTATLVTQLAPYLKHGPACLWADDIHHDDSEPCTCGLFNVVDTTQLRLMLLPAEARQLGMQLILESEDSIMNAVAMRILLEVGGLKPADALKILVAVSQGTREDHRQEWLQKKERQKADELMRGGNVEKNGTVQ
jgi:hypothetical protein